jgi:branched-chain amino acid transport system permease protein
MEMGKSRNVIYAIFFFILFLIPAFFNNYIVHVINVTYIYIILAIGYNLIVGYAGIFSFGHVGFFAIGAYITGLLTLRLGVPFWFSMPIGIIASTFVGALIGILCLRMEKVYLALATFGFAIFIQWVLFNWIPVTGGFTGISIPPPSLGGFKFVTDKRIYFVILPVTIALYFFAVNLAEKNTKARRVMISIRESEIAAHAIGVDIVKYKVIIFSLSAFYAGVAGGLYCGMMMYLNPASFGLFPAIAYLTMIVIGGLGSVIGSVLGAVLLGILPEILREWHALEEVLFGFLLLIFILFIPQGLWGVIQNLWIRTVPRAKTS